MPVPSDTKIGVLGLSYPFRGGISHYSTLLVRELRKHYPVKFITLRRQYPRFLFPGKTQYDYSVKKLVEQNDPTVDSINPISWIMTAFMLKKHNIDVLVVQWWNPFFAPAFGTIVNLLSLISRTRICFLCHNVLPHEASGFDRILCKYAFARANHFIVHSEADRSHLLSLKPGAIVRKTFLPTCSVFGEFVIYEREEARKKVNLRDDDNVLLFFGLIREYKGLKYLIYAMKHVLRSIKCTLLIVGEFYESKDEYISLIRELGVSEHIIVVDKYVRNEDVPLYFCSANIVVLPYTDATQSGIVQIAYALRTPVITTDVGGLPEVVADGETGFIVRAGSAEMLAEAIVKYFSGKYEEKFRGEIERRGDSFGWDNEVREIEAVVMEGHRPGPSTVIY